MPGRFNEWAKLLLNVRVPEQVIEDFSLALLKAELKKIECSVNKIKLSWRKMYANETSVPHIARFLDPLFFSFFLIMMLGTRISSETRCKPTSRQSGARCH